MKKEFNIVYTLNGKELNLPKDKFIKEIEIELISDNNLEETKNIASELIKKHLKDGQEI